MNCSKYGPVNGQAGSNHTCDECGRVLVLIKWDADNTKSWLPKHPTPAHGYKTYSRDAIERAVERYDELGYRVV